MKDGRCDWHLSKLEKKMQRIQWVSFRKEVDGKKYHARCFIRTL